MADEPLRSDRALLGASVRPRSFELSGLARAGDDALWAQRGWDAAFWSVGDERSIDDAIVLIGHRDGAQPDDGWELEHFDRGRWRHEGAEASDGEAIARHDGFVYIIGSHFGSLRRGLQRKRAFVARFAEKDVALGRQPAVELQVAHNDFRLHRAINDALRRWTPRPTDLSLLGLDDEAKRTFMGRTTQIPELRSARRIAHDDWPINIEGLAFGANGTALLGLRFPVDREGHPFIVAVERFADAMFGDAPLAVGPVWVLHDIGTPARPAGIRDLESDPDATAAGAALSLIIGGIGGEFAVDDERPDQRFEHWQTTLAKRAGGGPQEATRVRPLAEQGHVEGIALWPGVGFAYVADSEKNAVIWFDRRDAHVTDE